MRIEIDLPFADGLYTFKLTLIGIDEIQRKAKAGMGEIFARLLAGRYIAEDGVSTIGMPTEGRWDAFEIVEIIRQGLIGGAKGTVDDKPIQVDAALANKLVQNYVLTAPWRENWAIAATIATAAIEGVETDEHPVKKNSEPMKEATAAGSTSPEQSATAP